MLSVIFVKLNCIFTKFKFMPVKARGFGNYASPFIRDELSK